jgi:ABC-type polysaccharide/polyol phosphate transport system ATPase subunit
MSDVVVRAEGLGKKYLIGHQTTNERYTALRDILVRTAKGLALSASDVLRGRQIVGGDESEEFWALKEVNFEIKRGEVVGIIGRNGAGKSTLLKILSRITEPSTGRVAIKGRVASLLEVGTGFHPELTGRENIYLNGAILGMSRAEIKGKFEEIVAFAEVEKFLDTPVKRYSSGMYVRLAFAVAAHLEPEILIVDEVLAVGDAEFQKKCLGKMGEVAGRGRTVLLVSHNIGSVTNLCKTGILLKAGAIISQGAIAEVTDNYQRSVTRQSGSERGSFMGPLRTVKFMKITVNNSDSAYVNVNSNDELDIRVEGWSEFPMRNFNFGLSLFRDGVRLFTLLDEPAILLAGKFSLEARIDAEFLRAGEYSIALGGKRLDGDEWTWGTGLGTINILDVWTKTYAREATGYFNVSKKLVRSN